MACPYFSINNLNKDFVRTKGFSLVFQRSNIAEIKQRFPYLKLYLERAIQEQCNAFYLNPLYLEHGSRVDPHIDRSLRSYCEKIDPPMFVSVLYINISQDIQGGELVLRSDKKQVGQITPQTNKLVLFQGDLTHSVNPVLNSQSRRLSLVCEQYFLEESQLRQIPPFKIESRVLAKVGKKRT
jgi:predicted 2-oxoglutarate/Fe(II)-dependent dioxygenase YbiX